MTDLGQVAENADWVCSMHPFSSMRSCALPEDTTIVKAFAGALLLVVPFNVGSAIAKCDLWLVSAVALYYYQAVLHLLLLDVTSGLYLQLHFRTIRLILNLGALCPPKRLRNTRHTIPIATKLACHAFHMHVLACSRASLHLQICLVTH